MDPVADGGTDDGGTDGTSLSSLVIPPIVGFLFGCVTALYITIPGLYEMVIYPFSVIMSIQPIDNVDYYWSLDEYYRGSFVNYFVLLAMIIAIVLKKILHCVTSLPEDLLGYFVFGFIIGFGFLKNHL